MEMLRYRDRNGLWWLGMRRLRKSGRRPSTQPVLGPLAPGGLEFRYLDKGGLPTANPRRVASIGITVTAPPVHLDLDPYSEASMRGRRVDLRVALRNLRRP